VSSEYDIHNTGMPFQTLRSRRFFFYSECENLEKMTRTIWSLKKNDVCISELIWCKRISHILSLSQTKEALDDDPLSPEKKCSG